MVWLINIHSFSYLVHLLGEGLEEIIEARTLVPASKELIGSDL